MIKDSYKPQGKNKFRRAISIKCLKKYKTFKGALTLIELMLSLLIVSVVLFYSLDFTSRLYQHNSNRNKQVFTIMQIDSIIKLIENYLKYSKDIFISSSSIIFTPIDIVDFCSDDFDGNKKYKDSIKIYHSNNNLYFNNVLLAQNITHFSITQSDYIEINICIDNICQKEKISK